MSGTKYLADTNAVLYMLSGNECMCPYLKDDFAVSAITFMELLSYPGIQEEEEKAIRSFLNECELLQIDSEIMEQTITLRRAYKIKLPDAIIAATAITHSMSLITADTGFNKIIELSLERIAPC